MKCDARVVNLDDLEDILDELIGIYDNPPEGIDINDFDEGDIQEGTLKAEPNIVRRSFRLQQMNYQMKLLRKKRLHLGMQMRNMEEKLMVMGVILVLLFLSHSLTLNNWILE